MLKVEVFFVIFDHKTRQRCNEYKNLQRLVVTSSLVLINRCEKDIVRGFGVKKPLCLFPWPWCPFSSLTADWTATW